MALFKRQSKQARKAASDPSGPQGASAPAFNGTDPAGEESPAQPLKAPSLFGPPSPAPKPDEPKPDEAQPAEEPSRAVESAIEQATSQEPASKDPAPPEPAVEEPTQEEPAQEAPAPEESPVQTPAVPDTAGPLNETLPVALEPELRRIIDTAVARVASIELEAIRESRQLTQRSEEEGREALKFALDRGLQLVNSFELMTVTITSMVSTLRVELDSALEALQQADDPYSHLTRGSTVTPEVKEQAVPALPETAENEVVETVVEDTQPEPVPDVATSDVSASGVETQAMNGDGPEQYTEPSPEMTEMFREQIINMKNSGKTKEEAERSLLRFNLGRRFIGLLDEIYSEDSTEAAAFPPAGQQRKRFARRFFSRR